MHRPRSTAPPPRWSPMVAATAAPWPTFGAGTARWAPRPTGLPCAQSAVQRVYGGRTDPPARRRRGRARWMGEGTEWEGWQWGSGGGDGGYRFSPRGQRRFELAQETTQYNGPSTGRGPSDTYPTGVVDGAQKKLAGRPKPSSIHDPLHHNVCTPSNTTGPLSGLTIVSSGRNWKKNASVTA